MSVVKLEVEGFIWSFLQWFLVKDVGGFYQDSIKWGWREVIGIIRFLED